MDAKSRTCRLNPPPQTSVNIKPQPREQETSHPFALMSKFHLYSVKDAREGITEAKKSCWDYALFFICSPCLRGWGRGKQVSEITDTYAKEGSGIVSARRPLWKGSGQAQANALRSLSPSQKRHNSSFLSDLPGLQREESDNDPVLVQGQLLGEELEEAGAVAAVLLRGAHNTDGRDQEVGTGLCGFVHQQGHARSYRHAHALQGTQK